MADCDQPDVQLPLHGSVASEATLGHEHLEYGSNRLIGSTRTRASRKLAPWALGVGACICVIGILFSRSPSLRHALVTRHGIGDIVEFYTPPKDTMRAQLEPQMLRWKAFPTKCIGVKHGIHAATLHVTTCDTKSRDVRFLIPSSSKPGPIQWEPYPEVCLSWHGGHTLDLGSCGHSTKKLEWIFDATGSGQIRNAAQQETCLDVTDDVRDGHLVRVWSCSDKRREASMSFTTKDKSSTASLETAEIVYEPVAVDCTWGPWLDWSDCSLSCDSGTRSRSRVHAEDAAHGGEACHGKDTDEGSCNTAACPSTTTTPASLVEEIRSMRSKYEVQHKMISKEEAEEQGTKSGSIRQNKGLHSLLCVLTLLSVFERFIHV